MQPIHALSDRTMAEARLGPGRLAGAYAWHSMLENKVPLAFGSDYPNDDFNPFHGWVAGFTRADGAGQPFGGRSEEHTSELQSLMRISYAVFCLKKKTITSKIHKQTV